MSCEKSTRKTTKFSFLQDKYTWIVYLYPCLRHSFRHTTRLQNENFLVFHVDFSRFNFRTVLFWVPKLFRIQDLFIWKRFILWGKDFSDAANYAPCYWQYWQNGYDTDKQVRQVLFMLLDIHTSVHFVESLTITVSRIISNHVNVQLRRNKFYK